MVVVVLVLLLSIIDSIGEKLRIGANILFYSLLAIWYVGIIIDYFKNQS